MSAFPCPAAQPPTLGPYGHSAGGSAEKKDRKKIGREVWGSTLPTPPPPPPALFLLLSLPKKGAAPPPRAAAHRPVTGCNAESGRGVAPVPRSGRRRTPCTSAGCRRRSTRCAGRHAVGGRHLSTHAGGRVDAALGLGVMVGGEVTVGEGMGVEIGFGSSIISSSKKNNFCGPKGLFQRSGLICFNF